MGWKSWVGMGAGIGLSFIPGVGPFLGSAAMGLGQAADQADTAKKASQIQQDAVDKSIAFHREIYDQTRADLEPYRQGGGSAMGTLGTLMGLPMGGGGSAPPAAADEAAATGPTMRRRGDAPIVGHAQPRTEPYAGRPVGKKARLEEARRIRTGAAEQATSSLAPTATALVRMRAPNGRVVMVPSDQVEAAQSRGGRIEQ